MIGLEPTFDEHLTNARGRVPRGAARAAGGRHLLAQLRIVLRER